LKNRGANLEYTELGKIVNTHGIKGEVRIYPYTDDMKAALKLKKIYLDSSNLRTK